eukprot:3459810-Amphidinium_carterae.1
MAYTSPTSAELNLVEEEASAQTLSQGKVLQTPSVSAEVHVNFEHNLTTLFMLYNALFARHNRTVCILGALIEQPTGRNASPAGSTMPAQAVLKTSTLTGRVQPTDTNAANVRAIAKRKTHSRRENFPCQTCA